MVRAGRIAATFLAGLAACSSPPPPSEPVAPGMPLAGVWTLSGDWASLSPNAFEAWVTRELPEDVVTPFDQDTLRTLADALDRMDASSVRAAVLLGRSRYVSSASILIRRLEQRVLGPERNSDCGDAVAAAALARFPDPGRYAHRLVALATGRNPHPDLEVRVECAATALHAGHEAVIPFLLQVLRIGTWDGEKDQRDFAVSPTTAWARGRAAEALSLYAGLPLTYQIDGSIEHRQEEAAKLAERLLPVPASVAPASSPPAR
jgi:hypothetical protein